MCVCGCFVWISTHIPLDVCVYVCMFSSFECMRMWCCMSAESFLSTPQNVLLVHVVIVQGMLVLLMCRIQNQQMHWMAERISPEDAYESLISSSQTLSSEEQAVKLQLWREKRRRKAIRQRQVSQRLCQRMEPRIGRPPKELPSKEQSLQIIRNARLDGSKPLSKFLRLWKVWWWCYFVGAQHAPILFSFRSLVRVSFLGHARMTMNMFTRVPMASFLFLLHCTHLLLVFCWGCLFQVWSRVEGNRIEQKFGVPCCSSLLQCKFPAHVLMPSVPQLCMSRDRAGAIKFGVASHKYRRFHTLRAMARMREVREMQDPSFVEKSVVAVQYVVESVFLYLLWFCSLLFDLEFDLCLIVCSCVCVRFVLYSFLLLS